MRQVRPCLVLAERLVRRRCNRALAALAGPGLVLLALAVAGCLLWFNLVTSISFKFATASIAGLMALQMLALFDTPAS